MKLVRITLSRPRIRKKGFVLNIRLGNGAGYKLGRTFFLAHNSGSKRWRDQYLNGHLSNRKETFVDYINLGSWELGFTRNANLVPYAGE